ncbi:MAG: hypothetical protein M1820_001881 [Bogoriella megaspora]|nr:MAG: hypothetical protein M1820_001881 [Bogoriella megaspora]
MSPPFFTLRPSSSSLPAHCEPTITFLRNFSTYFGSCIPTPLAFLSIALGTLSIVAWFFAQLPQIYKNYKYSSTSGLSIFFLVIWCLGDLSNLLGALFTDQATWQMIVAGYYCFVDMVLVGQWFWYEKFRHGKRTKIIFWKGANERNNDDRSSDVEEIIDGLEPLSRVVSARSNGSKNKKADNSTPPMEHISILSSEKVWRTPDYGSFISGGEKVDQLASSSSSSTPKPRSIRRDQNPDSPLPFAAPKTLLFISLLLSIASVHASPPRHFITPNPSIPFAASLSSPTQHPSPSNPQAATLLAGKLLSWLSTLLYLGSRLPQLIKNARRRSTAGLSPALFLAAFFGNLFYSSSLLTNPSAWHDFPRYGGGGWAPAEGSCRAEWVLRATPFFLGAAGVLLLDAAVGVQFLIYGEGNRGSKVVVKVHDDEDVEDRRVVEAEAVAEGLEEARRAVPITIERGGGGGGLAIGNTIGELERPSSWQRVTGWMRGWVPSPQQRVGIEVRRARKGDSGNGGEGEGLLDGNGEEEDGYGGV